MKITVNGAGVTPAAVSLILADLEKEYGLKVRDLTMYVRFADKNGRVVEPKLPGIGETELVMTINEPAKPTEPAEPPEPISIEDMRSEIEQTRSSLLTRTELERLAFLYEMKIDKATFLKALHTAIAHKPDFPMRYFEKIALAFLEEKSKI